MTIYIDEKRKLMLRCGNLVPFKTSGYILDAPSTESNNLTSSEDLALMP